MLSGAVVDVLLGSGALDVTHVVLQGANEVDQPQIDPVTNAASGFFSTLIIGAIMLAAAPGFVDSMIEDILEEPIANFAWGIITLIAFVIVIVVLIFTVVGILVAIPLAIVFVILGIVGNVLAYLAICDGFVDSRWVALLVAAVAVAVLNFVPVVGPLVSFVVGSVGLGAVVRRWL